MSTRVFFGLLSLLGLAFIFSSSTASTAQSPNPTRPVWVKPTAGVEGLPPYLHAPSKTDFIAPDQGTQPASPVWALEWFRMVFQSYRDDNWEVYAAYGNGSHQTNLTNNVSASDARPDISPDCTRVVFNSDRYGSADIFVMNYDGSGLAQLTPTDARDDYAAYWSPDGSRIAFVSNRDGASSDSPAEVYVMNADGTGQTRLTYSGLPNDFPNWSPDGTKIAWVQYQAGGSMLMIMNADGSNQAVLAGPLVYLGHPAWSPDGTRIAFDYDADGDIWNELAAINANGTGLVTLYDPGCTLCDAWMGNWAGSGEWLLFSWVNYVVYQNELYLESSSVDVRNLDGTGPMTIISTGYDLNPDWQSLDILPPQTHVLALPEYSPASGFDVLWTGVDEGPSGLSVYNVQSRIGAGSAWEDFFQGTYAQTSAPFSSDVYDTAYFQSQGIDMADNIEPWTSGDGDTWTHLYSWLFGGTIRDMRGYPLDDAEVAISPDPWEGDLATDRAGEFQVHLKAEGAHTLNASHAGYGASLPANTYLKKKESFDRYLMPAEDLLTNGNFEASGTQLTGWSADGTLTPTVVDGFSGLHAAGLGYNCGTLCLTDPEELPPTIGLNPKLAADAEGNLHVLYVTPSSLYYIMRAPGGMWSQSFEVGIMASGNTPQRYYFDIAIDTQGGVHVTWSGMGGIQYRKRLPDGTWTSTSVVILGNNPALAVDDLGGVHVIFTTSNGKYYINRSPSGIWSSPVLVFSTSYQGPVDIAVGADHVVHFLSGDQHEGFALYRSRQPDGTLTAYQSAISTSNPHTNFLFLKIDANGVLHAFSVNSGDGAYATKTPGGSWSPTTLLGQLIYYGDMDVDATGRMYIFASDDYLGRYTHIDPYGPPITATINLRLSQWAAIHVDPFNNLHLMWQDDIRLIYGTTPHALTDTISAISQVVAIPEGFHQPTLSFMYNLWGEADCHASEATVNVSDSLTTTQIWSEKACAGWSHAWIDLSPWASQTVTVTFALHQAAGDPYTHLYLDNISIGSWMTPIVGAVYPTQIEAWVSSTITVTGENFIATPAVYINDTPLTGVEYVNEHTLHLHLPGGLALGSYTIRVINPGGQDGIGPSLLKAGNLTYMPIAIRPAAP